MALYKTQINVKFFDDLGERLQKYARKESVKQDKNITAQTIIRSLIADYLKRKG